MSGYQQEAWFVLLQRTLAAPEMTRQKVAAVLGVSAPLISQVLNGSGKYGAGEASPRKLAAKILHTFGQFECPHLSEQRGEAVVIQVDQCRSHAHRPVPTNSPLDIQFWQACHACPHKPFSAPPVARAKVARKKASSTAPVPIPQEPSQ